MNQLPTWLMKLSNEIRELRTLLYLHGSVGAKEGQYDPSAGASALRGGGECAVDDSTHDISLLAIAAARYSEVQCLRQEQCVLARVSRRNRAAGSGPMESLCGVKMVYRHEVQVVKVVLKYLAQGCGPGAELKEKAVAGIVSGGGGSESKAAFNTFWTQRRLCILCFRDVTCRLRTLHRFFPVFKKPGTAYTRVFERYAAYRYEREALLPAAVADRGGGRGAEPPAGGSERPPEASADDGLAADGLPRVLVKPCLRSICLEPQGRGCLRVVNVRPCMTATSRGLHPPAQQPFVIQDPLELLSQEEYRAERTESLPSFGHCKMSPALMSLVSSRVLETVRESSWVPYDKDDHAQRSPSKFAASAVTGGGGGFLSIDTPLQLLHELRSAGVSVVGLLDHGSSTHFRLTQQRIHERKVRGFLLQSKSAHRTSSLRQYKNSIAALRSLKPSPSETEEEPLEQDTLVDFSDLEHWEHVVPPPGHALISPAVGHLEDMYNSTNESADTSTLKLSSSQEASAAAVEHGNTAPPSLFLQYTPQAPAGSHPNKRAPGKEKMSFTNPAISPELPWYFYHFYLFVH